MGVAPAASLFVVGAYFNHNISFALILASPMATPSSRTCSRWSRAFSSMRLELWFEFSVAIRLRRAQAFAPPPVAVARRGIHAGTLPISGWPRIDVSPEGSSYVA